jgi:WD40 repeat protein
MVDNTDTAIVGSYDSTLSIWNLNSGECANILSGPHGKAVTEFDWRNSLCVSGDRDGLLCVWDINKAKCIKSRKVHNGQVSKIVLYSDGANANLILSGGASVPSSPSLGRGALGHRYAHSRRSFQEAGARRLDRDARTQPLELGYATLLNAF